jgi:type VI protein secretion system component VasA
MTNPIKDNEILRYYEAEMRYLRDAGREFADAFPDRARELGLIAEASATLMWNGCSKASRS